MFLKRRVFYINFIFLFTACLAAQKTSSKVSDSLKNLSTTEIVQNSIALIGPIYFTSGSDELNKSSITKLIRLASVLNNHPIFEVLIVTQSDSKEIIKYSSSLSIKRAEVIERFLIDHQISKNRIYTETKSIKSKCSSKPKCKTRSHRKNNRKADFVVFSD